MTENLMDKTLYFVTPSDDGPTIHEIKPYATPYHITMKTDDMGTTYWIEFEQGKDAEEIFETQEQALFRFKNKLLAQHAYHSATAEFMMKNLQLLEKKYGKKETISP